MALYRAKQVESQIDLIHKCNVCHVMSRKMRYPFYRRTSQLYAHYNT